jgi:signal transduction histidine kinase
VWEHRLVRYLVEKSKKKDEFKENYFKQGMELHVRPINSAGPGNLYLVAGPMFVYPLGSGTDRDFHNDVKTFVDSALNRLKRSEIKLESQLSDLLLAGKSAGWIYDECLSDEAEILSKAMGSILSAELGPEMENLTLTNSSLHLLGTISLLLHREIPDPEKRGKQTESPYKIVFRLDRDRRLCVECEHKDAWNFRIEKTNTPMDHRAKVTAYEQSNFTPADLEQREKEIKKLLGEYGQSFASQFNGYTGSRVKDLSAWMDNRFGVVSVELGESVKKAGENYRNLAGKIATLFIGDTVSLYYYDSVKKRLRLKIAEPIMEDSDQEREILLAIEEDILNQVDEDPSKKENEICYRAVKEAAPQFCESWTPGAIGGDAFPLEQTLLNPRKYGDHFKTRSAIAVPMKIHGHLFGVLKLQGYSPFQFRREIVNFVEQVAGAIAPYLYQQDLLSRLSELSDTILAREKFEDETYKEEIPDRPESENKRKEVPTANNVESGDGEYDTEKTVEQKTHESICEAFAKIFLADASAIFVPNDKQYTDEDGNSVLPMKFVASCNRPSLDASLNEDEEAYTIDDQSPVNDALIKGEKNYNIYNIKDWANTHRKWQGAKKYRKETATNFDYIVVVPFKHEIEPLYVWDQDEETQNLAALSLYYKVPKPERENPPSSMWEHTARFISNHVSIYLHEIRQRGKMDDSIHRLMRHEIKHLTNSVAINSETILEKIKKERVGDALLEKRVEAILMQNKNSRILLNRIMGLFRDENFRIFQQFLRTCRAPDPVLYLISEDGVIDVEEGSENIRVSEFLEEVCSYFDSRCLVEQDQQTEKTETQDIETGMPSKIRRDLQSESVKDLRIRIHKRAFEIITHNLLENATNYCLRKDQITVSLNKDQDGKALEISFKNRGRALQSSKEAAQIFRWGKTGSNSGDEKIGTGIGLYVAQAFCNFLGIQLILDEYPRKNKDQKIGEFEFVITLPFSEYPPLEGQ